MNHRERGSMTKDLQMYLEGRESVFGRFASEIDVARRMMAARAR